jgi:hypothetical protein
VTLFSEGWWGIDEAANSERLELKAFHAKADFSVIAQDKLDANGRCSLDENGANGA